MNHFLYKLIPPRPTFASDMDETEASVMAEHATYWRKLTERGTALVFGPVDDPAGVWGLAIVAQETEDDVRAMGDTDPAVVAGVARFAVYPLLGATVARSDAAV